MLAPRTPEAKSARAGPNNALRALTVLLAALLALTWVVVEKLAAERELAQARHDVEQRLGALRDRLNGHLRGDLLAAEALVSLIHLYPDLDQALFERAAAPLLGGRTQLRNIAGAPDMVIRLMAPLAGNEKAIGLDYRKTPSQFLAADWARLARETVVAGPLTLVQGGEALIARIPVYLPTADGPERFWGLISAVIDVERLYVGSGLRDADLPIEVALRGRNASGSAGEVFFGRAALFDEKPATQEIELPLGSWLMAAAPVGGWPRQAAGVWSLRAAFAAVALVLFGALAVLRRALVESARAHAQARAAERQVSALIQNAPDAMVIVDPQGSIVLANAQAEKLFGWSPAELLGRSVEALMPERHRRAHGPERQSFFAQAEVRPMRPATELVALRKDGGEFEVEISLSPLQTEQGPLACAVVRDVTERRRAERELRRSERRLRTIADSMPALIAQLDADRRFVFANATYGRWYGQAPQAMIGQRIDEVFDGPEHASLREQVAEALQQGERLRFEAQEGERHVRTTCVPEFGDDGKVVGLFVLAQDITDLKAVELRLTELARFDHLTGLLNRRSFDEELARALGRVRRTHAGLGLMFVDADHFKGVNDKLGHAAGDLVLQAFAKRLGSAVRMTDTVSRLGGDEFVVILEPLRDSAAAQVIALKVAQAIREPIQTPAGVVTVTASIGIAWLDAGQAAASDAVALQAAADEALYAAKQAGRDRFEIVRINATGGSAG